MFTNRSANLTRSETPPIANTPDLRGRLSFSSPLLVATKMPRPSLASPSPIVNNRRLVDYHMSQQNPAVLDDLYNNDSSSSPGHQLYNTMSQHRFSSTPPIGSIPLVHSGKRNSIVMSSLMKQSLNNNFRHSLGSTGSSLVQLATAKVERVRNGFPAVSPVIVKLSSRDRNRGDRYKEGWLDDEDDRCNKPAVNPCDRDVVVSALKQKCRKRWNSSCFDDEDRPLSSNNPPLAKRPKPGGDGLARRLSPIVSLAPDSYPRPSSCPLPQPGSTAGFVKPNSILARRRLGCQQNGNEPAVPDEQQAKRLKVAQPANRVSLPVMEDDRMEGVSTTDPFPMDSDKEKEYSEKKRERERSSTPLVDDEEEHESESVEKVRNKRVKRESTIKLQASLSQVFPSRSTPGAPARKKLPVLCSTGTPPDLPTDLSNKSVPVTGKELKRDRQVRIERMRRYLSQDDDNDGGGGKLGLKSWSVPTVSTTSSMASMQKSASGPAAVSLSTALGGSGGVLQLGLTTTASSTTAGLRLLSTQPAPSFPAPSSLSSSSVPTSSSEGLSSGLKLPVLATTAGPAVTSTCSSSGLTVGMGGGLQVGSLTSAQPGSSTSLQPSLPTQSSSLQSSLPTQSSSLQSSLPPQSFSFPLSTSSSSGLASLSKSSAATESTSLSTESSTSQSNKIATLTTVSTSSIVTAPFSLGGGSDGVSSSVGVPTSLKFSESVAPQSTATNFLSNSLQPKDRTGLAAAPILARTGQTTTAPVLGGIQTSSQQTGLEVPSFLSSSTGTATNAPSSSLSLGLPSSSGSLSAGFSMQSGAREVQAPLPGQPVLNLFGSAPQQKNTTVSIMQGAPSSSVAATTSQPGFSFSVSKSVTLPSLSSITTSTFGLQQQQPSSVTQASPFGGQPSQPGTSSIGQKLSQLNNSNASFKLTSSGGSAQSQAQALGSSGGVGAPSFFSQAQQAAAGGLSSNLFQSSAPSGQNVAGQQQQQQGGFLFGSGTKLSSDIPSHPTGGVLSSLQSSRTQQQQQNQTSSLFSGMGAAPSVSSSSGNSTIFGAAGLGLNSSLAFGAGASQLGATSSSGPFSNQGSAVPSQVSGTGGLFGAGSQPGTATPSFQFGAPAGQTQQPPAPLGNNLFQFSANSGQQEPKQPGAAAAPSLQLGQGTFNQQPSGGLMQMNASNVFGTQSVPNTFNFSGAGGAATGQTPALADGKLNFGAGAPGIGGMAGTGSIQQPQNNGMSGFTFSGMGGEAQQQSQTTAPSFNFSAMGGAQQQNQAPSFNFSGMAAAQQNTTSSFNFAIAGAQQQSGSAGFNFSAMASNAGLQQPNAMGGAAFNFGGNQPISSSGAVNFSLGKSRTASLSRQRSRKKK